MDACSFQRVMMSLCGSRLNLESKRKRANVTGGLQPEEQEDSSEKGLPDYMWRTLVLFLLSTLKMAEGLKGPLSGSELFIRHT